MRVTDIRGNETEAFLGNGHVVVLGLGSLPVREFRAHFLGLPDRRNGERRVQRDRRRASGLARRMGTPRRRMDAITLGERDALLVGIEWTCE
jgi:hypothetical protein